MSAVLQSRRLVAAVSSRPTLSIPSFLVPGVQRRTVFWFGQKNKEKVKQPVPTNPLTEEYLKRKPATQAGLVKGGLAGSSVFEDEQIAGPKPSSLQKDQKGVFLRNTDAMAAALDPKPAARERWERKMVIREIHKRGRLTRAQIIKRQERELVSKSHNFQTSVKKLGPLARQIAGKSVEEAIVQMRFSKKKAAIEVRKHLENARNEAIVKRGMGLGAIEGKTLESPIVIKTKDGKRVKVNDPTRLYVEQAWVGKGDHGFTPDHRARGQINIMQNPTTHLALVLKEEATRIRQHTEREDKFKNKKVWVQLPNRPITSQRQYYSW